MLGGLFVTPLAAEEQNNDWRAVVSPDNSLAFMFLRGDERVFSISLGGWGPQWGWVGFGSHEKARGEELAAHRPVRSEQGPGTGHHDQTAHLEERRQGDFLPLRAFRRQGRAPDHADRGHRIRREVP